MTTSRGLVRNTVLNVLTLVSGALISFFLIRFFLAQLGASRYGVWVLIGSILQYRRVLDMGMNSSIDRYIPVSLARSDKDAVQRVLNTSLFFFLALAIVFVLLSFLIYENVGNWFSLTSDMIRTAGLLVLVIGLSFGLAMPLQPSAAMLCGLQRYDVLNLVELLMLLLRTALVVILVLQGYGLLTMGIVFGISEIVVKLVQFFFARRLLPTVSITPRSVDFHLLKEMLAYGTNTFLYRTGALLTLKAMDLIIGIYIGTAEVSQFAVAVAGVLVLSQFLRAFTTAIKPAVSDLDARNDHARVREISFLMQKYNLLIIIPAAVFFIIMGKEFIQVCFGQTFHEPSVVRSISIVMAIITTGHCLRLTQYSNFMVLVGKGDHRLFGILAVVTGLLCISASIVSVKVFDLGLLGIAWSNCIPMALISSTVVPIYFNRKMNISVRESVARIWRPALLGAMPAVILIGVWKCSHFTASWSGITTLVVAAGLLTCLSAWHLSLTGPERDRLGRILARCLHRY